jgi:glycerol-3-phosphate acyltransferase PlsX
VSSKKNQQHVVPIRTIVIALDVMGGDHAPLAMLEGCEHYLSRCPVHELATLRFALCGDRTQLEEALISFPLLKSRSDIHHANHVISGEEKPSVALRASKDSSMRLAIELVKDGKAAAAISGGNTGALMAIAKVLLRMLPMIDRPAIAAVMPTMRGSSVMLDLGANIECTAEHLLQFSIMGSLFAKAVLHLPRPSLGLLNVGSEEVKGSDTIKLAAQLLKETSLPLNFHGYIEGDDITQGTVDVIVTDGFTGNVALKTAEGTAKLCMHVMKQAFMSSWLAKIGGLLAKPALKRLFARLDHRQYNGAMLLGLNGIIVKSHGSADAVGCTSAIQVAISLVKQDINQRIVHDISLMTPGTIDDVKIANPTS